MKFSKKTQYGLRAMVYLTEAYKNKKRICSLKEISENENISFSYLEKILLKLEKQGLISSRRGSMGGYYFRSCPDSLSAGDNAPEDT